MHFRSVCLIDKGKLFIYICNPINWEIGSNFKICLFHDELWTNNRHVNEYYNVLGTFLELQGGHFTLDKMYCVRINRGNFYVLWNSTTNRDHLMP